MTGLVTARRVAWALLLLLALQLHAVRSVGAGERVCEARPTPVVQGLSATLRLDAPTLHRGGSAVVTAALANLGPRKVVVRDVAAVLLAPGTHDPVTWSTSAGEGTGLRSRSATRFTLVVHATRCSDGTGSLAPGFYDLALLLRADGRWGLVGQQAVVISP